MKALLTELWQLANYEVVGVWDRIDRQAKRHSFLSNVSALAERCIASTTFKE